MVSTLTMCHHLQFIMLVLTFGDISQCTQWKMRINIYLAFIYCINNSKVHSRQVMIPFWGLCNKSFRIVGGINFATLKYVEATKRGTMSCNETIPKWFLGIINYFWILGEHWPHLIFKFFIGVKDIEDGGNAWCLNVSWCIKFVRHLVKIIILSGA